jgi:hypothetical protein
VAKTGMRQRAIAVPPAFRTRLPGNVRERGLAPLVDAVLGHGPIQGFEPLLALAAASISSIPGARTSIAATVGNSNLTFRSCRSALSRERSNRLKGGWIVITVLGKRIAAWVRKVVSDDAVIA